MKEKVKNLFILFLVVVLVSLSILSNLMSGRSEGYDNMESSHLYLYHTFFNYSGNYAGYPNVRWLFRGPGNPLESIPEEFRPMNGALAFCMGHHMIEGNEDKLNALVKNRLTINDYDRMTINKIAKERDGYQEEMKKFALCLASATCLNTKVRKENYFINGSEYKDDIWDAVVAQSMIIAIEGRDGPYVKTIDKADVKAQWEAAMQIEFMNDPSITISPTLWSLVQSNKDKWFDEVWTAAIVMYNMNLTYVQDPSDPTIITATIQCFGDQSVMDNYYSKIKVEYVNTDGSWIDPNNPPVDWQLIESSFDGTNGTLKFKGKDGISIATNPLAFTFLNNKGITDVNKPMLYEFWFKTPGLQSYQEYAAARQYIPTVGVNQPGDGGDGGGGGGGGSGGGSTSGAEGTIDLEIHRYKHTEGWQTNYNVNLIKYDSETGKPLSDSRWDILEYDTLGEWSDPGTQLGATYLDHPIEQASTIKTNYNWANDEGTQFERWDDPENDYCGYDDQITGADGYLYEVNSIGAATSTKAHKDVYNYTYTKGYCTGHPKPVIHYYICDHEDDCDCDEKNAELDRIAAEAYQDQIDYCERLAAEGGFFHTAATSISDEAKNKLQADRDKFYKDYISLTYDYSAKELEARNGYILHDLHTDDIPVEVVTIHSSEYLDEISGGGTWAETHGGGSEEGDSGESEDDGDESDGSDEEEEEDEEMSISLKKASASGNAAVKSVSETELTFEDVLDKLKKNTSESEENNVKKTSTVKKASDSNIDASAFEFIDLDGNDDDEDETDESKEAKATPSNGVVNNVVPKRGKINNLLHSLVNLIMPTTLNDDEDDDGGGGGGSGGSTLDKSAYARYDAAPPKHSSGKVIYTGAINFEKSTVAPWVPGRHDIVCWTFIIYDHRTEGEIHFNKRDLDLKEHQSDSYDTYGQENADGTLEGAVYGLFAVKDIVHPDSNGTEENDQDTGIVYKTGDLVSVTTTDRNGDASFMVFTEAPGSTYNYDTGTIEKRTDIDWDGPSNLHKNEKEADKVNDNEMFYGWNTEGSDEVTLTDSEPGPDETAYQKHSSNQGLNKGLGQDDGTTYPIRNDEDNNGNVWIGRPLIVSGKNEANYYIKELSRSEGYELSVYGHDMTITNKDAHETGGDLVAEGSVSIGKMSKSRYLLEDESLMQYNTVKLTAVDTFGGFDIILKNLIKGTTSPSFSVVSKKPVTVEEEVIEEREVEVPIYAVEGQPVLIDGERVEAKLGDTVRLPNGQTANVMNTSTDSGTKLFNTINAIPGFLPTADNFNAAVGATFMEKYNNALANKKFETPAENGPWILVPKGANEQEDFDNMTSAMADYVVFGAMKIVAENLSNYVVQYSYGGDEPDNIYDVSNQIVWIKKPVKFDSNDGFVYAKYNAELLNHTGTGFMINDQVPDVTEFAKYDDLSTLAFSDTEGGTYWTYAKGEQLRESNGDLAYNIETEEVTVKKMITRNEETLSPIEAEYDADENAYTLHFDEPGEYEIRIIYTPNEVDGTFMVDYAVENVIMNSHIAVQTTGTYIKEVPLRYPGDQTIIEDNKTIDTPTEIEERPIRQKIKVVKDIQTTPDSEEYIHDTYSEVHDTNLTREDTNLWYADLPDWLIRLLGGDIENQSASKLPQFRFKTYLKSNLERLYRNENGYVVWRDRDGNVLVPKYADTNGDGNYDTFTWMNGTREIDFPERDIFDDDSLLKSSNVQKIYTEVPHNTSSTTTGDISNNVWAEYQDPQEGLTENVGELRGDNTSQDGDNGEAVYTNEALYSYDDKNTNIRETDKINADQNSGYTRLLETEVRLVEDGAGKTRNVEQYNYEKFFDAIAAANTDIWDDDMHSTYKEADVAKRMENYPGQRWFDTFKEDYQKDDTDPDHTAANVDGVDKDNTAGGDRDTSFKPFQWIREHFFGVTEEAKNDYTATHDNGNLENVINTSDTAHINAEASDAVRQFAIKWYLDDEVAKLVTNNGYEEDVATAGSEHYQEEVYDQALFEALKKAYNYLKPFYVYDLDTIYSVEWDTAENGGSDNDYTTLSADTLYNVAGEAGNQGQSKSGYYYGVSSYLPYGTYVLVEQQPYRENLDDFDNKHYKTDLPKEIELPAVYEEGGNTGAPEVMNEFYNYASADTPEKLAEKYAIRFNEEWAENHTDDLRHYVIRSHGYDGDYEVYKYGLDVDKLDSKITYASSSYDYDGFNITQDIYDPLKNYYNDPLVDTPINGGNADSHYAADDVNKGVPTASGIPYPDDAIEKRYHYGSISENYGTADDVIYPHGPAKDDNNPSGYYFKDGVKTMTGNQTAYEGKYASMLVPWTVVEPVDSATYDSDEFSGYADRKFRNTFYTTKLRIEKLDSETGENILHDDAIFSIYAASRYLDCDEIEEAANLIADPAARTRFIENTEIGDTKMYLEDTLITGSYEFLTAMGARDIAPAKRARGAGEVWSGIVPAGTPVCLEEEQIIMEDMLGSKTGQFKVYTTLNDIATLDDEAESDKDKTYRDQNTGYLVTPQPLGAGTYVLVETKAPVGYAKTKPMAIEIYSDSVSYYANGDMTTKVDATIYEGNLMDPKVEAKTEEQQDIPTYH